MSDRPEISVIIPAYNAAAFVGDAIRSVLDQQERVELIVVDDGSTDDTAGEVARFGDAVHLVSAPRNEGLPSALNRGLASATGELIGFLDADDVWQPGRLGMELNLLSGAEADALWGITCVRFLEEDGSWRSSQEWPPKQFPSIGAMLFRRRVFDRLGGFDASLQHAPDIDFLARFAEAGLTFLRHEEVVLTWRRHTRNMTNDIGVDRDYFATAVRRALARRRAVSPSSSTGT